jgi:hypothetical protein
MLREQGSCQVIHCVIVSTHPSPIESWKLNAESGVLGRVAWG